MATVGKDSRISLRELEGLLWSTVDGPQAEIQSWRGTAEIALGGATTASRLAPTLRVKYRGAVKRGVVILGSEELVTALEGEGEQIVIPYSVTIGQGGALVVLAEDNKRVVGVSIVLSDPRVFHSSSAPR